MRPQAFVTVLLLLTGRLVPAAAQHLSAETLQAINTASHARVRLADAGWHRLAGIGGAPSESTLVYVREGSAGWSRTEVPVPEARELQVARGSNAGRGASIGGAIGLGLSIVAVIVASGDEWTTPSGGQAIAAMLLNTAAGAGVGALAGRASTHWQTVYRADVP